MYIIDRCLLVIFAAILPLHNVQRDLVADLCAIVSYGKLELQLTYINRRSIEGNHVRYLCCNRGRFRCIRSHKLRDL